MSVTYQPTDGLTGVGARDAYASKNDDTDESDGKNSDDKLGGGRRCGLEKVGLSGAADIGSPGHSNPLSFFHQDHDHWSSSSSS